MKQNPKNSLTTKDLCFIALFMALVCVSTLFFKIPIPLGYAHLGNGFIFLASVFLGNPGGLLCAGVGSALADFFGGYQIWILPTLIIKSIMGFTVSAIARPKKSPDAPPEKTGKSTIVFSLRTYIALLTGTIIMVAGYVIAGALIQGNLAAGLAQIPGLVGEDLVGILVFLLLGAALEKSGIRKMVTIHR